jgi:hypothetical protein
VVKGRIQKANSFRFPAATAVPLRNVSQTPPGGAVIASAAAATALEHAGVGAGLLASGAGTNPPAHGSTGRTAPSFTSCRFADPPFLVLFATSG